MARIEFMVWMIFRGNERKMMAASRQIGKDCRITEYGGDGFLAQAVILRVRIVVPKIAFTNVVLDFSPHPSSTALFVWFYKTVFD